MENIEEKQRSANQIQDGIVSGKKKQTRTEKS